MQFIEAKDRNLSDVLSNNRYKIDSFQREYRWHRKHIEALISDICICFDKFYKEGDTIENYEDYGGYYMGPIVLCDEKKSLSIIDGQQRLTSFTLLLIFLHHAQAKLDLPKNQVKDLRQFLYVTKGGKTTLVLNVESRNSIIEHIINTPDVEYDRDLLIEDESVSNLMDRFEDINKLFPEDINTKQKLPIFIEWMLDKLVMVVVKAYTKENAYTIFETMNDRGLSLNPTEILKGYLLSVIDNEVKSEEMNDFWKSRITYLKSITTIDGDLDFFRAWLRAKYAVSIRTTKQGSKNEDFETIGTHFHSWVKNNPNKTYLKQPEDFYYFIRSDFDFFSLLYLSIYKVKNEHDIDFTNVYISNFYPLADSLTYPLIMAPISKVDNSELIDEKISITAKFIDVYTLKRVLYGKSINQSSIRSSFYELIKTVRNQDVNKLVDIYKRELHKINDDPFFALSKLQKMDNRGFYHYLYARLLFMYNDKYNFTSLLRSKRRDSLVLFKIFEMDNRPENFTELNWQVLIDSVSGYCLVRRYDLEEIESKIGRDRLVYLLEQNYMPEMISIDFKSLNEFIDCRDEILRENIQQLLNFK